MLEQLPDRATLAFMCNNAEVDKNQHEWCECLQDKSRGQLSEADKQRALPDVAKIGVILLMTIQINRVAGERIDARIECGQCG